MNDQLEDRERPKDDGWGKSVVFRAIMAGLGGLAVRMLALSMPFLFHYRPERGLVGLLGPIFAVLIYVFAVIPMRCMNRESLRRAYYSRGHSTMESPYLKWLLTGFVRHVRGWVWGLPFMAATAYCVFYLVTNYETMPAPDLWVPVQNFPTLLGMAPSLIGGIAMVGAVLLLLLLLFAYGWRKDVAVEYLPVRSMEMGKVFRWARRMHRHHGPEMRKCTFVNFLLWLPGALGLCAVAASELLDGVDISAPMAMSGSLDVLIRNVASPRFLILTGAVFFLVYVPLCVYRKVRIAKTVAALMKKSAHHKTRSSHHEAG